MIHLDPSWLQHVEKPARYTGGEWNSIVKDGKVWDRVTLTFPVLETAKSIWFTVVGSSKEAALARVLRQRAEYEEYSWEDRVDHCLPGAVLTHDPVEWYVDESAYSKQ